MLLAGTMCTVQGHALFLKASLYHNERKRKDGKADEEEKRKGHGLGNVDVDGTVDGWMRRAKRSRDR